MQNFHFPTIWLILKNPQICCISIIWLVAISSLLHLMHAHASTLATSLIRVKNNSPILLITLVVWNIGMKKMKERSKTSNWTVNHFFSTFVNPLLAWMLNFYVWLQSNWTVNHFFSTFVNPLLAWMLNFYVWLQNRKNSKFGVNTINSLVYIRYSRVSLFEPWQNNLTILREELYFVQGFIDIEAWLLLIFFICLHNYTLHCHILALKAPIPQNGQTHSNN